MPQVSWYGVACGGLLLVLGLCLLSALIEHVLELRDAARLTANDTFFHTVRGRRIRYRLTGAGTSGPTLVLLNGIAGSLEQWDKVQTALSTESVVLSYDRGGAGFSDPARAQGAAAITDELDLLLRSPKIAGPFVLVGYSSSAMMAIVFAARHPDVVKGIVFLDPIVGSPGPGGKTHRRNFWRLAVVNLLEALFGYTRLKRALAARSAAPSSPVSERSDAILKSTHHWLASGREAMSLDEVAHEADVAMTTLPFADLPLGVLITEDFRDILERQRKLAASSKRAMLREIHCKHSQLLDDPAPVAAIVDMVRAIAAEVRIEATAGIVALKTQGNDAGAFK